MRKGYEWYDPSRKKEHLNLDEAWAYFEHSALPCCIRNNNNDCIIAPVSLLVRMNNKDKLVKAEESEHKVKITFYSLCSTPEIELSYFVCYLPSLLLQKASRFALIYSFFTTRKAFIVIWNNKPIVTVLFLMQIFLFFFNSTLFYSFMHFVVMFLLIIIKSILLCFSIWLFRSKKNSSLFYKIMCTLSLCSFWYSF